MTAHARKMHRILAVQQQLHQIEHWRLTDLHSRSEQLAADQKDLIAALNKDDALQGLFIVGMARRLQSLADAASKTAEETEVQSIRLLEQAGRLICAERTAAAADLAARRTNERKDLLETIERLADRAPQASRKIVGR
jgi:uncharacterized protein YqcC (DUF446 family)